MSRTMSTPAKEITKAKHQRDALVKLQTELFRMTAFIEGKVRSFDSACEFLDNFELKDTFGLASKELAEVKDILVVLCDIAKNGLEPPHETEGEKLHPEGNQSSS